MYINCIIGKDFHRYRLLREPTMFLKYGRWLAEPRENAPFFDKQKIILRQTADSLIGFLDDQKRINLNNVYNVGVLDEQFNVRYILALPNSKFLNYCYQRVSQEKGQTFAEAKKNYLEKLPIAVIKPSNQILIKLVDKIIEANKQLFARKSRFHKLIQSECNIKIWSNKLDKWYYLDFIEFVTALKVNLSLQQKDELLQLFEKYRTECLELDNESRSIEDQIDELVYELYRLSPEEIARVKNANS